MAQTRGASSAPTTTTNSAKQTLVHRVDKKTCACQSVRELVIVSLGRGHCEVKLVGLPDKFNEFEKHVGMAKASIERDPRVGETGGPQDGRLDGRVRL